MALLKEDKTNNQAQISADTVLKIAKEITVKFIEVGRITPSSFEMAFTNIYNTINKTVRKS